MNLIQKLKSILHPTMLPFLLVGIINTLFGTAVMFFCYRVLHLSYWISSGANYFFGSILSFYLNKRFTFKSQEKGFAVLFRFIINILVCWVLAYGIAQPITEFCLKDLSLDMPPEELTAIKEQIAMLVGMIFFTALNYFGQRFFTFTNNKKKEGLL